MESNFGETSLGNQSTEHHILVPTLAVLSLSEKSIKPLPEGTDPLTEAEAKALLRKVNFRHPSWCILSLLLHDEPRIFAN